MKSAVDIIDNKNKEIDRLKAYIKLKDDALEEAYETLAHSKVFVVSRQKIKKPEGEYWYDYALDVVEKALSKDGWKK